jgi:DNA-binding CsgD family transcriptional regulator
MPSSYSDTDGCSGQAMLHLLDRVYAAAAAEILWDATLEDIRRAGQFAGVALVAVDRAKRQATMLAAVGLGRCRETGRRLGPPPANPLHTDAVLGSKPGAIWFDHEIIAPVLWAETAFATIWMRPQGLVDWGCVTLASEQQSDGTGQVVLLEVYGGAERALGGRAFDLLSRLAPHLLRAWRLGGITRPSPSACRPESDRGTAMTADLPPDARLRCTFGLTKAEARLAMHLAKGRSLACAAEIFGVRLSTLRSQLGQIYGKTGTNRQVELAALLHRSELASNGVWVGGRTRMRVDAQAQLGA